MFPPLSDNLTSTVLVLLALAVAMAAAVAMAHRRAKNGADSAAMFVDVQILPDESKWLRVAEFDKMVGLADCNWQRRRVILTCDELLYAPIYSQQIVDRVNLNQIADVKLEEKGNWLEDTENMSKRVQDMHRLSYTQEDEWGRMSYLVRKRTLACPRTAVDLSLRDSISLSSHAKQAP